MLCDASSTIASCFDRSFTSIVSPSFTRYDGMFTRRPFTCTWPCEMNCRAANGVIANFMRYTTASSRRSSSSISNCDESPRTRTASW